MFCRNCGKELTGSPENCPGCGAKLMKGTGFCPNCGAPTTPLTEICPKCGARVAGKSGSWMPLVAGILDLLIGIPALLIGIVLSLVGAMLPQWIAEAPELAGGLEGIPMEFFTGMGVVMSLLAVVAIVGGIFALRKRRWGLALAGSICAIFAGVPLYLAGLFLGIPAVVFTALGKVHFK